MSKKVIGRERKRRNGMDYDRQGNKKGRNGEGERRDETVKREREEKGMGENKERREMGR